MARLVRGDRGGQVLVLENFRYHRHRTNLDNIRWRCWRFNCRAVLRTNIFNVEDEDPYIIVQDVGEHVHPPDREIVHHADFRKMVTAEVQREPTVPIRRIYNAQRVELQWRQRQHPGGRDRVPPQGFLSVRSVVARARSAVVPPIPATIEEVRIEGPWAETWGRDQFLWHMDNAWGIAVFATEDNIRKLQRCGTVYMDATFKSCPRPYKQVFTVLGDVHGFIVPLVHVLMIQRTTGHYRQVFHCVKSTMRRVTHHHWRPQKVICDFEQALITALETELTRTRVCGCYFHFNQALWKRVQGLGLAPAFRHDHRLAAVIRKVMALGHLPLALVQNNFDLLVHQRSTRRAQRDHPELQDFFQYVGNTYVHRGAAFPPAMWNVYVRNMEQRTNNHVECK